MVKNNRRFIKRLVIDIAGMGLIVIALLIGWLPGPGGVPLFLAGLALLASNHEWAERHMERIRIHGKSLTTLLFPQKRWLQNFYDVAAVAMIGLGIVLFKDASTFKKGLLLWVFLLGLTILLLNRRRASKIKSFFSGN